jgi:D-glycero-D-manno-heptose 1,7-bisphosphate phosphatase
VQALRKVAFLARDGVINVDRAYVSRWEDFEFVPSAVEVMRALKQAGFALVILTNQSGIACGYYTEAQYQAVTARMKQVLVEAGALSPGGCCGRIDYGLRLP